MNNYKINSLSFAFIVICLINSNLLGMVIPYLIRKVKTSVVLTFLISFILGLIYIYIFLKLFNLFPNLTLSEKVEKIFSKKLSKVINTLIVLLTFLIVIIVFWRFSTFISSEYLTETPPFLISLLLAGPIFMAMFKDFDIAARCATIIIISILALFIFSRLSLLTSIKLDNYKPLITSSFKNIFKCSIFSVILEMTPLMLTLNIPKSNITNSKNLKKDLIIAYIFSFIILTSITLTIIGVLGVDVASLYTFPSYIVLKNISMLNFIKNIENFSVIFWVMFMSFTCAFGMVFIKTSLKLTFKISKQKLLNTIMIILFVLFMGIILVLLPYENFINKYKNAYVMIPFIIYSLFIITIILILIFGIIKSKKHSS